MHNLEMEINKKCPIGGERQIDVEFAKEYRTIESKLITKDRIWKWKH